MEFNGTLEVNNLPSHLFLLLQNNERISVKNFLNSKAYDQRNVTGIINSKGKKYILKMKFPFILRNLDYVRLYSLMLAEGSKRTEFRLNVPEKELHSIFKESLIKLFPNANISKLLSIGKSHGIPRSNAPSILRFLIPIPDEIPNFIKRNEEFSKEFLKIFFEAEGTVVKNRIKLTQSISIGIRTIDLDFRRRRIFLGEIKKKDENLWKKIISFQSQVLLDIQEMLKIHFGIDSIVKPESLRINKTERRGKVTLKWVITITSKNINKFANEIGLLSNPKVEKLNNLVKVEKRNPKFFALEIMSKLEKRKNYFTFNEFIDTMKNHGYVYASVYLWRFQRSDIIKKISRGKYKIVNHLGTSSALKTSK